MHQLLNSASSNFYAAVFLQIQVPRKPNHICYLTDIISGMQCNCLPRHRTFALPTRFYFWSCYREHWTHLYSRLQESRKWKAFMTRVACLILFHIILVSGLIHGYVERQQIGGCVSLVADSSRSIALNSSFNGKFKNRGSLVIPNPIFCDALWLCHRLQQILIELTGILHTEACETNKLNGNTSPLCQFSKMSQYAMDDCLCSFMAHMKLVTWSYFLHPGAQRQMKTHWSPHLSKSKSFKKDEIISLRVISKLRLWCSWGTYTMYFCHWWETWSNIIVQHPGSTLAAYILEYEWKFLDWLRDLNCRRSCLCNSFPSTVIARVIQPRTNCADNFWWWYYVVSVYIHFNTANISAQFLSILSQNVLQPMNKILFINDIHSYKEMGVHHIIACLALTTARYDICLKQLGWHHFNRSVIC